MKGSRRISVCVDDYGLHDGVNRAALDLARRNRISAISCLVDGPAWMDGATGLRVGAAGVEIGLHVNLTEDFGAGGVRHPLGSLITRAYAHRLDREAVAAELRRQFARFEDAMGRGPDFVDGHQHVHQLPVIRDALLDVMDERYEPRERPWIRSTRTPELSGGPVLPPAARFKALVIELLGARVLQREAAARGYQQNAHLVGVYGFGVPADEYRRYLRAWCETAGDGDLLVCHPSVDGSWPDPLREARVCEYQVLGGDGWTDLATRLGVDVQPHRSYCM